MSVECLSFSLRPAVSLRDSCPHVLFYLLTGIVSDSDEEMQHKDELHEQMTYLKKHFAMMDEQQVPVPEEVRATFAFLNPEYERMQQSLEMLDSKREDDIAEWNATLDEEIKAFGDRIKDLRVKAQNPQITQDSDTPEVVLEEALQLRKGVEELEAWASQAQSFQTIFGGDMDICGIDRTRGCRH